MPLNPTPQRKQIFQFPTPNLDDRVFYELHDSTQMNYKVPEYGTPHPNQAKYEGFVFALVKPADQSGWVTWFYLNERANQDEYNFEITYPYADTDYPAYVRTYVLKRDGLVEPEAGDADPVHGVEYQLTAHKQTRLADPLLDSLFVGVQRAYERLPGPTITSYSINSRGDVEAQFEQVVPSGTELQADGLTVMKSALEYESTVKGKKVYSTVGSHSVLNGALFVDSLEGVTGTLRSSIVNPNTTLPTMGSTYNGALVVSATKSPISATKSELKVVTVPSLPTTTRMYYNERGDLETETTKYVVANTTAATPPVDSLNTTKAIYQQDSVGFGRVVEAKVSDHAALTSVSYSSNFKGAKVTETTDIVPPTTVPSKPTKSGATVIVADSVEQKTRTKAVKRQVVLDAWPTLYDYFFEDELSSWVSVKYEIITAAAASSEVGNAGPSTIPFEEVEYKAIDANWTAKTTKKVLSKFNKPGIGNCCFRQDRREVEYDFPSIFLGVAVRTLVSAKGNDYAAITPIVLSGIRKYVQATVDVIYCQLDTPLTKDLANKDFKVTQIIPVNVGYNGFLIKFDAGRCLSAGDNYVYAFSGTSSTKWQPPIYEQYNYPRSYPPTMPETVKLPVRVTPWKYNLFKHELWSLDTKLPVVSADPGTGALYVQEP